MKLLAFILKIIALGHEKFICEIDMFFRPYREENWHIGSFTQC